jgi:hypothetical protein
VIWTRRPMSPEVSEYGLVGVSHPLAPWRRPVSILSRYIEK